MIDEYGWTKSDLLPTAPREWAVAFATGFIIASGFWCAALLILSIGD